MLAEIVWNQNTLGVLGAFSVPICAILGGCWIAVEKIRADSHLKSAMIQRGMSVEEIERVLSARRPKN